MTTKRLRIASLLPSTTDICISLGLERYIVGITHECDFGSSHPLYNSSAPLVVVDGSDKNNNSNTSSPPLTLTVSQIDPHIQSQAAIDAAVKSSVHNGISLYNLNDTALTDCNPTIILTQSLCDVCAVAKDAVDSEVACNLPKCTVLSLEPETLDEVVDTFITVADACGVKERGIELSKQFWKDTNQILQATSLSKKDKKPKVLFMEWLNPPFDAGHWITDMLEYAGCSSALPLPSEGKGTRKSIQLDWQQIYDSDPDVVIIGCCGFDMIRNEDDARAAIKQLEPLRAFQTNNIYASDGNLYFARPGPGLREGIAILARCAYDGEAEVVDALEQLPFMPGKNKGWSKIDFTKKTETFVPDIEDVTCSYSKLHEEACLAKTDFYTDPSTGYSVYTEYAIKKRGKCCGSGCRHCPYNHENVKDKAKHIQQPAFLFEGASDGDDTLFASLYSIPPNSQVKILFWSSGKDSYLTLRQLVRERITSSSPFHLILLTTFDAESRIIAHQEVPIADVVRQAKHLGVPLLGVPLRRGSGESYVSRIDKAIAAIHKQVEDCCITLVFGDLHLDHIRQWRDEELKQYKLQYPLWKVPYEDLIDDLEKSGVDVTLSAVTVDSGGVLREGKKFNRQLMKDVKQLGMDEFGEQGEFHSLAKVWTVSRERNGVYVYIYVFSTLLRSRPRYLGFLQMHHQLVGLDQ